MSTDSIVGKTLNVVFLGLYNPVMKALFPGQKSPDANINTDPGQTSTYGAFITRTHGTIGQSGNIIWLEKNKLKAVVKKAKKSGKGGGTPAAAPTVTYFATFAVALCEGPIAGVRRIWVGPDLVYDAGSDDLESIIASNKALKNFKIYLGTDTQAPDPRIQADRGAANTPAYPGLAYIVVTDLALAKYGNSIQGAQIKVEVVNSSIISPTISESIVEPITASGVAPVGIYAIGGMDRLASGYYIDQIDTGSGVVEKYKSLKVGLGQPIISDINFPTAPVADDRLVSKYPDTKSPVSLRSDSGFVNYNGAQYPLPLTYAQTCDFADHNGALLIMYPGRVLRISLGGSVISNSSIGSSAQMRLVGNYIYCISTGTTYLLDAITLEQISATANSLNMSGKLLSGGETDLWLADFSTQKILNAYKLNSGGTGIVKSYTLPLFGGNRPSFYVSGNLLVRADVQSSGDSMAFEAWSLDKMAEQTVPLSAIVATEVARSALIKPADIDTTGLAGSVIGYRITAAGSIRNALEPLRAAFPFDAYQSGYKIRFRSRGTGSVATIPIGHLIADTQLEESREMDSQLPQRVTVQYLDRARDYDQNEQSDERLGAESVGEQNVSVQVVMTGAHAKQTAEKLLYLAWLERSGYSFKLPPIYSGLESSDVITIVAEFASYELRLVSASPNSDGLISCSGVPSNAAIYTSAATGDEGQQAPVTIPLAGASVAVLLDVPVVDETVQNAPGFVAAMTGYTGGWAGGTVVRSADDGQTWDDVQGFGEKGTFGYAQAPLAANAGNLVQRGGSLTVSLLSGFVDGVTEAQMFGGSNTAAYGAHGRWEIIRFQNATLNPDGSYTLDTFWRGDKGTEWATGLHQSGDLFVLLNDPDNAFVSMSQDSIGQPRTYRAVTFDADIDSASDIAMTYTGVNLECLSPCHPSSSRDGSANLTAKWVRRTRVGGAWRDYVDASLGETSEAYEIDVMSGGTVKRTLTSSTQSVIYSAANQISDFGSAQASITLRIYQLSAVVGRGYPLEATL